MKLVPAFLLIGLSIIHLIYVIAVPSVLEEEQKRDQARKAVALSLFYKSKRYAPVRFPQNRRNDVMSHLWNYIKYTKVMGKQCFKHTKERLELRIVDIGKRFLNINPSGRKPRKVRLYFGIQGNRNQRSGAFEAEKETNRNIATAFPWIRSKGGEKMLRKGPVLHVTASAYEMVKQISETLESKIQAIVVIKATVPKLIMQSLKATRFADAARPLLKQMAMLFPPFITQEPLLHFNGKRQEEELVSSTYVPVPSTAPSVEPSSETYPEPMEEQQGFNYTPQFHDIKVSASPEPTVATLDKVSFYSGTVVTYRNLAGFVARK